MILIRPRSALARSVTKVRRTSGVPKCITSATPTHHVKTACMLGATCHAACPRGCLLHVACPQWIRSAEPREAHVHPDARARPHGLRSRTTPAAGPGSSCASLREGAEGVEPPSSLSGWPGCPACRACATEPSGFPPRPRLARFATRYRGPPGSPRAQRYLRAAKDSRAAHMTSRRP